MAADKTPERRLLRLLDQSTGGSIHIAGIVECRAALRLVEQGRVTIRSGDITEDGGSGHIAIRYCEAPTRAQQFGTTWASTTHGCERKATTFFEPQRLWVCGQHARLLGGA